MSLLSSDYFKEFEEVIKTLSDNEQVIVIDSMYR